MYKMRSLPLAQQNMLALEPALACEALQHFAGIKRRMELRDTINSIAVYDDFAHHPTAITTTLEGLRKQVGDARIIAVLEPRSNTMKLGTMSSRLPESLQLADVFFC
ncbi:UDP-N-acetylmuramate:L-alanyl-gamma-D-glutamyl-meso-diaminopimelate ligase [Oligella ureolytica]